AIRDGLDAIERHRVSVVQTAAHRGRAARLDAVDANLRIGLLDRDEQSRNEAAAADRHDHRVQIRDLLEQLQAYGSLPGGDKLAVERMDEQQSALALELASFLEGFHAVRAEEHHFGAVIATCRGL